MPISVTFDDVADASRGVDDVLVAVRDDAGAVEEMTAAADAALRQHLRRTLVRLIAYRPAIRVGCVYA